MTTSTLISQDDAANSKVVKRARGLNTSRRQATGNLLNTIPSRKTDRGNIYICGTGDCAQLGKTEDVTEIRKPEILDIDGKSFVDICCGGLHSLALTDEGELYSWGCNDEFALGRAGDECVPELVTFEEKINIVQLAAGDSFSAILTSSGDIYLWGAFRTSTGLLGFVNQPGVKQATPMKLIVPGATVQFATIVAGNNHLLALTTIGTVYAVGDNDAGQLGLRMSSRVHKVSHGLFPFALNLKNIVNIAAGGYHSFAISQSGKVYAWGQNNFYQCGVPLSTSEIEAKLHVPTVSRSLSGLSPIHKIAAGEHHSHILTSESSLYGFGRSDSNQVGVRTDVETSSKTAVKAPQIIPNIAPFDVAAGSNHCLAIQDEQVLSWGFGESCALGHGKAKDEEVPRSIDSLAGKRVLNVSGGGHHSVFLVQL